MNRPGLAALGVACALWVTACGPRTVPATGLLVAVDTDLQVPAQIDSVTISVQTIPGDGGASPDARVVGPVAFSDIMARPLTLGITPASDALDPVQLVVSGRLGNSEVVRRQLRVSFSRGETRAVPMLLARRCAGVTCNSNETCTEASGCRRYDARPEDTFPVGAYCAPGMADCDSDLGSETSNGCETDTRVSTTHCGRCGHACGAGETCEAGLCAGEQVVEMAAGGAHTCALRASGAVMCWGLNANGQLGTGMPTPPMATTPQAVHDAMGFTDVEELAAGDRHTCARTHGGEVYCWGRNDNGQLGFAPSGGMNVAATPTAIGAGMTLPDFAQIALGESHSCARTQETSARVFCWGNDSSGQLGNGSTTGSTPNPREVPMLADVTDLAAGSRYNCVVRTGGAMTCWGQNNAGQLGTGSTASTVQTPTSVSVRNGSIVATQLAAGVQHTCARAMTRRVYCWGDNSNRQLGDGSTIAGRTSADALAQVVPQTDYTQVAAGSNFTCAVRAGGEIQCWGANDHGQLGRNSSDVSDRSSAGSVSGPRDFAQVVTGAYHACGRRSWGGVMCWGENGSGQLGDGSTTQRTRPVYVSGLP